MNILVACEESQVVTIEFRNKGHNAFSCDIQDCSGGYPEWHIKADVIPLLNGYCDFKTVDGVIHKINKWDMIIGFPPCTYLTFAGNQCLSTKLHTDDYIQTRKSLRSKASDFFMSIINADCPKIAVENPLGYMNIIYCKPTQIIHPYYFGDNFKKRTCLWLKGLPRLVPTDLLPEPKPLYTRSNGKKVNFVEAVSGSNANKQKIRSKTFPGIAKAMAEQWSDDISVYYLL